MTATRTSEAALIVFLDLTHFAAESKRAGDAEAADVIDGYYQLVADAIASAGGRTVKFIGDATLAVFPEERIDDAAALLLDLVPIVERFMQQRSWQCELTVRAHFGVVVAGEFGASGEKHFDVIGQAVNDTARMASSGITLSREALAKLSPHVRAKFNGTV